MEIRFSACDIILRIENEKFSKVKNCNMIVMLEEIELKIACEFAEDVSQ